MSKYSQSAGQIKFRENKKPHFLLKNEVFLSWRRDFAKGIPMGEPPTC